MAVVVVGGQSRNIGKTAVVAGLIARMPELRWTAFKITPGHEGDGGHMAGVDGFSFDVERETATAKPELKYSEATVLKWTRPSGSGNLALDPNRTEELRFCSSGTDTARFLAAGAVKSIWVRARSGHLADAMPRIREELERAENAIFESNSIVEFLRPDLYLAVLDPARADFKESARFYLDRADAILWSSAELPPRQPRATAPPEGLPAGRPQFSIGPPEYISGEIVEFVRSRIAPGRS